MPVRSNGDEIRRRRKLMGLSLTEFAVRAGYSLNHCSQVELGNSNAGPRYLRTAAKIFGCGVGDLMTEATPDVSETDAEPPKAAA